MKRVVAIGVTIAICGVLVLLFLRERDKRAAEKAQERIAEEIARTARAAKPELAKPRGEPDHVIGRVLPVDLSVMDTKSATRRPAIAQGILAALAPELQADRVGAAGTIVYIDPDTAFYVGDGASGSVPTGVTLTFYEGEKPIARKTLEFPRPANAEATAQQLADDRDRMSRVIATYINGLPRR